MSIPYKSLEYLKLVIGFCDHPKLEDFAERLGEPLYSATGRWVRVLEYAGTYLPDGVISRYGTKRIAKAAMWDGSPDVFVGHLVGAKLVDDLGSDSDTDSDSDSDSDNGARFKIHDWDDYHGDVQEWREVNAAKSEGGKKGNHIRHHVLKNAFDQSCSLCLSVSDGSDSLSDSDTDLRKYRRVQQSTVQHGVGGDEFEA